MSLYATGPEVRDRAGTLLGWLSLKLPPEMDRLELQEPGETLITWDPYPLLDHTDRVIRIEKKTFVKIHPVRTEGHPGRLTCRGSAPSLSVQVLKGPQLHQTQTAVVHWRHVWVVERDQVELLPQGIFTPAKGPNS